MNGSALTSRLELLLHGIPFTSSCHKSILLQQYFYYLYYSILLLLLFLFVSFKV